MTEPRPFQIIRQFAQNGLKLLLENPRNLQELLQVTGERVVQHIDFARLRQEHTSFVAADYRNVESDLVFTAPLLGKGRKRSRVLLYILMEHQSEPDPLMVLRALGYVVEIYRYQVRLWSQHHRSFAGLRLNPVLPVVFYTGTRRWEGLGNFADLVQRHDLLPERIPALAPLFINLSALPAAALEAVGSFGWVLRLLQERRAEPAEFAGLVTSVVEHLKGLPASDRLRWLELLSYLRAMVYHERETREGETLEKTIEASVETDELREEVRSMHRTMADVLRAEGMRKGRKLGQVQVLRKALLDQLLSRFGNLPSNIVVRIRTTHNVSQLQEWLHAFATAQRLEDMPFG